MPLRIKCPTGHSLIVPDDRAGRLLRCPRCSQAFTVPAAAQSKPTAALTAAAVDQVMNAAVAAPSSSTALIEPPPNDIADAPARDSFHDRDADHETDTQRPIKPKSRVKPSPAVPAETPPPEITSPAVPEPPAIEEISPPALAPEVLPGVESSQPTAPTEPVVESHPFEFLSQPEDDIVEAPPIHRPAAATALPISHDANLWNVYQLSAAVVAAALFSMVPAIWDVVEYVQIVESQFVARWALVLLFLGIVQLAYAVYLFQLPDWASVWVVTLQSLMLAGLYAAVLGLVLISREEGFFVRALQLHDKLAGGKAVLWCLCMVCVWTIMAFFAGRLSVRWHQKEQLARAAVG